MKSLTVIITATAIIMTATASGQEIILKNNFFTGWHYSLDGVKFHKVGISGKTLRYAMEGNEAAQAEMDGYKSRKTTSTVFGYIGGFLLGWPLGGSIAGREWDDTYTAMAVGGGALAIVSFVFDGSASNHLKKAVRIYNGEEQPGDANAGTWLPTLTMTDDNVLIGLTMRF